MPASGLGVLVFLVAVAPGFYYEILRQRRFTRAKESAFFEISRTLVASVIIGLIAGSGTFLAWLWAAPNDPPNLAALLRHDPQYIGDHAALVIGLLVTYLGASVVISHVGNAFDPGAGDLVTAHSLWHEVFRKRVPPGRKPVARVTLKSGAVWMGKVAKYSAEHELADRELVLFKPIYLGTVSTGKLGLTHHESVVLRGAEIESFSVDYPEADPSESEQKSEDAKAQ